MHPLPDDLDRLPFQGVADARLLAESATHAEALARIEYLVEQGNRLGLLLGEAGTGKSSVLEVFAAERRRSGRPAALVNLVGLEPYELIWQLAAQLGVNPAAKASLAQLWRQLADRLAEHRYQHLDTVLLVDDADLADEPMQTALARLLRIERSPDARLTVVLAAGPSGVRRLRADVLGEVALRMHLEPWAESETIDYLRSQLERFHVDPQLFDLAAMQRLHALAGGTPREVNRVALLALLAGSGNRQTRIEPQTIDAVYEELFAVGS